MPGIEQSETRQQLELARTQPNRQGGKPAVDAFGLSDVGRERTKNEDAFLIASLERALVVEDSSLPIAHDPQLDRHGAASLFIVADGMGGMGAGDVASRVAVASVADYFIEHMPLAGPVDVRAAVAHVSSPDIRLGLDGAIRAGDQHVKAVAQNSAHPLMGTTLTMAYVLWPQVYIAHAGDSRCYVYRRGELCQMTHDHSLGGELVRSHVARGGPQNGLTNVLLNALGAGLDVQPEISRYSLERGDQLVLCSDGLTKHVSDDALAHVLARDVTAKDACRELVALANGAGGSDNITVLVARF